MHLKVSAFPPEIPAGARAVIGTRDEEVLMDSEPAKLPDIGTGFIARTQRRIVESDEHLAGVSAMHREVNREIAFVISVDRRDSAHEYFGCIALPGEFSCSENPVAPVIASDHDDHPGLLGRLARVEHRAERPQYPVGKQPCCNSYRDDSEAGDNNPALNQTSSCSEVHAASAASTTGMETRLKPRVPTLR